MPCGSHGPRRGGEGSQPPRPESTSFPAAPSGPRRGEGWVLPDWRGTVAEVETRPQQLPSGVGVTTPASLSRPLSFGTSATDRSRPDGAEDAQPLGFSDPRLCGVTPPPTFS